MRENDHIFDRSEACLDGHHLLNESDTSRQLIWGWCSESKVERAISARRRGCRQLLRWDVSSLDNDERTRLLVNLLKTNVTMNMGTNDSFGFGINQPRHEWHETPAVYDSRND